MLPHYFEVLIQAGNSARFLGDPGTAASYYGEAGTVRADSWIPPYNLACLRATTGDPDGALVLLGEAVDRGFTSSKLLDENDDFDGLRTRTGWALLAARVRDAAHASTH